MAPIRDYYAYIELSSPNFSQNSYAMAGYTIHTNSTVISFWHKRLSENMCRYRMHYHNVSNIWIDWIVYNEGDDSTTDWVFLDERMTDDN